MAGREPEAAVVVVGERVLDRGCSDGLGGEVEVSGLFHGGERRETCVVVIGGAHGGLRKVAESCKARSVVCSRSGRILCKSSNSGGW